MASSRFFRYLAPNLITLSSMIFGLVSLWASEHGDYPLAAWLVVYAVFTDRLDGLVARAIKGTSELGMQLDSFADFLNFGIAPAFLVVTYLSSRDDLPYAHDGTAHLLLFISCGVYMLCAVFRLARYNVLTDDKLPVKIFFGFPTTLAGALLSGWILVFLKYDPHTHPDFGGAKLFGDWQTPTVVWKYFPIAVAILGYLMASSLPMPKLRRFNNRLVSIALTILLTVGYVCGFLMRYPEVLFWMPTTWSVIFLIWGQASATARAMSPPKLFPREPDRPLARPQEDFEDMLDESEAETAPAPPVPPAEPKPD